MKEPYKKKGLLSVTSISTSIFGQVHISSLKLNVSLYLQINLLTFFFLHLVRHELSRLMYLSNISLSDICFLSSLSSNHGYLSLPHTLASFSTLSLGYLSIYCTDHKYFQLTLCDSNGLDFVAELLALFYNIPRTLNLQVPTTSSGL